MKAIELFAGAGGLGMGISQAGFRPKRIVEWDRWCCDTIRENRKSSGKLVSHWPEPTEGDVRDVDFSGLKDEIHLVSGGPPCQPFSLGGKHGAHKDGRDMWSEAVRVVREVAPQAFLFENVKGLTRASFARYFTYISLQLHYPEIVLRDEDWTAHLARLEQHHTSASSTGLQYKVVSRVINAANYGVPQRRERVVFVGFRADLGIEWSFPQETHSFEALLWDQCRSERYWERHRAPKTERNLDCRLYERGMRLLTKPSDRKPWRTVRDAIAGLPEPRDWPSNEVANHRLQPGARSYPGHTGSPLDEAGKTLKAGVHGVPGGENMLALPDGTVRYLTVRESARLQTFPDDYYLHGSWSEAMRQLGNAVPVKLARAIAADIALRLKQAA